MRESKMPKIYYDSGGIIVTDSDVMVGQDRYPIEKIKSAQTVGNIGKHLLSALFIAAIGVVVLLFSGFLGMGAVIAEADKSGPGVGGAIFIFFVFIVGLAIIVFAIYRAGFQKIYHVVIHLKEPPTYVEIGGSRHPNDPTTIADAINDSLANYQRKDKSS